MSALQDLPTELLTNIVHRLAFDDLKSLRFVSRHCNVVCIEHLYRRLHISILRRHREAFNAIVTLPHLATAVREIVWEELDLESMVSFASKDWVTPAMRDTSSRYLQIPESQLAPIWSLFHNVKTDSSVFWLPRRPHPTEFEEPEEPLDIGYDDHKEAVLYRDTTKAQIVAEFHGPFLSGLGKLPNLTTVWSLPMPSYRAIPYRGYSILVDTLQSRHARFEHTEPVLGFKEFLIPAMFQFPHISHLKLGNEMEPAKVWSPDNIDCFRHLTSLDLCIKNIPRTDLAAHKFHHFFLAMPALKSLKLCLECVVSSGPRYVLPVLPVARVCDVHEGADGETTCSYEARDDTEPMQTLWPHLESLHLSHMPLPNEFSVFLGAHAATLRNLTLYCCGFKTSTMRQMSQQKCLKLSSFKVLDSSSRVVVSEDDCLNYINYKDQPQDESARQNPFLSRFGRHFVTEQTRFEQHDDGCDTFAWADSKQRPSLYSDDEYLELHGCLPPRTSITSKMESMEISGDDDEAQDSDDRLEDLLEYSEYKARQGRVYWDWCYHVGEWYWWPTKTPENAKTETSIWLFRSHHGEEAYGDDPLAWFGDWDSDAGDVAESTPFGKAFDEARRNPTKFAVDKIPQHAMDYEWEVPEAPFADECIDESHGIWLVGSHDPWQELPRDYTDSEADGPEDGDDDNDDREEAEHDLGLTS